MSDSVNYPAHYTSGPPCPACGETIEAITVTENMSFCVGNAIKYLWRAELKGSPVEDLRKAAWYCTREADRREAALLEADRREAAILEADRREAATDECAAYSHEGCRCG